MSDDARRSPEGGTTSDAALPSELSVMPRDLKVQTKTQRLSIEWSDGSRSEYSLGELRRQCPCATCRTERGDANPLKILKSDPAGVRVTHADLVGTYAIRFHWSDGHNTGIFDFRYLRTLPEVRDSPPGK